MLLRGDCLTFCIAVQCLNQEKKELEGKSSLSGDGPGSNDRSAGVGYGVLFSDSYNTVDTTVSESGLMEVVE